MLLHKYEVPKCHVLGEVPLSVKNFSFGVSLSHGQLLRPDCVYFMSNVIGLPLSLISLPSPAQVKYPRLDPLPVEPQVQEKDAGLCARTFRHPSGFAVFPLPLLV